MIIHLVAGTRPNYVKAAALLNAFESHRGRRARRQPLVRLVHTGQHYDQALCGQIFRDLKLPAPFVELAVGSSSHAVQTARIMVRFERLLSRERPELVIVVGDVNSTLGCALTAAKMEIPVAHVEAGMRSFDGSMPEEINRRLTDSLSAHLFTSCPDAGDNLRREGVAPSRIHFVGNVMVDTLLAELPRARRSKIRQWLGLTGAYAVLTVHRPSNVDLDARFSGILDAVAALQERLAIVFPMHPRTRARLRRGRLWRRLTGLRNLRLVEPLGYHDFIGLLEGARLALTDSGGIQEETTALGVPCVTLRENTERPVTLSAGTNVLAGRNSAAILSAALRAGGARPRPRARPALWDGKSAQRIVRLLSQSCGF